MKDKFNKVDFQWFIIRTLPHQEKKLTGMLERYMEKAKNILEAYCPTHTTVNVRRNGKEEPAPLFAGFVFVLSTQQAVTEFIDRHYPEGSILYEHKKNREQKARLLTIPEEQMHLFKSFNENYAEHLVILERPFSDYAFNPKTGEPNEIVKVIDGPLAGREGYLTRFRRDKRLVFNMKTLGKDTYFAVSIPNIWNFRVIRLHNAEGDRQSIGTMKERAIDLLIGMLQGCGYGEQTLPMLYGMMEKLAVKPSLTGLCQELSKERHETLSRRLAQIDTEEAGLILNLARYEQDNPGYVKSNRQNFVIRPFLTPTAGAAMEEGKEEAELQHNGFTEIIRKADITEQVYYPTRKKEETVTTTYYAHIGILKNKGKDGGCILFANWNDFLGEYFLTAGKANQKLVYGTTQAAFEKHADNGKKENLIRSFRNYAPTLYNILADANSKVKAIPNFQAGKNTLNVFAIAATANDTSSAKDELINTCIAICKEINTTTHLAIWRRYLQTVWLHK